MEMRYDSYFNELCLTLRQVMSGERFMKKMPIYSFLLLVLLLAIWEMGSWNVVRTCVASTFRHMDDPYRWA